MVSTETDVDDFVDGLVLEQVLGDSTLSMYGQCSNCVWGLFERLNGNKAQSQIVLVCMFGVELARNRFVLIAAFTANGWTDDVEGAVAADSTAAAAAAATVGNGTKAVVLICVFAASVCCIGCCCCCCARHGRW